MRLRIPALAALFLISLTPALAAPMRMAPPRAAIAAIAAAIAAANANDPAKVQAAFTGDAVIVDENPPFIFRGAQAGAQWWRSVQYGLAGATLRASAGRLVQYTPDAAGANAYAVIPLHIVVVTKSKRHISEDGLWAVTLRRTASGWKLSSAAWATKP